MTEFLSRPRSSDALAAAPEPFHEGPVFSRRLRDATKTVHREAERSGFLADLIRGRGSRLGYALYLRNLVPVYEALEAGIDAMPGAPLLAGFARPGLRRLPSLGGDLESLTRRDRRQDLPILPEAQAYAGAIGRAAAVRDESRLAAHAYARYLGDLSGGQILAPLLARSLGLDADALRFYAFPDLGDLGTVKTAIRAALDTVPVGGSQSDAIIAEAVAAFRHNIDLSLAVSRACCAGVD